MPSTIPPAAIFRAITLQASSLLRRLRDRGLLEKQGAGSRTHYTLTSPEEHVDHDTVQAELPLEVVSEGAKGGKWDTQRW